MSQILMPLCYLPPISYSSLLLSPNHEICLEKHENTPKQTYRNRCLIYGANGKLSLTIPVSHQNGSRLYRDCKISYGEAWDQLHWKSIKTAYQTSAYFDYYEDQLHNIYAQRETFLMDFNLKALAIIQKILKTDKSFTETTVFEKTPEAIDLRNQYLPQKHGEHQFEAYFQNFAHKHGFISDLSIIDLICNLGPEAPLYLQQVAQKLAF
jgi:WbqC-like protein family